MLMVEFLYVQIWKNTFNVFKSLKLKKIVKYFCSLLFSDYIKTVCMNCSLIFCCFTSKVLFFYQTYFFTPRALSYIYIFKQTILLGIITLPPSCDFQGQSLFLCDIKICFLRLQLTVRVYEQRRLCLIVWLDGHLEYGTPVCGQPT